MDILDKFLVQVSYKFTKGYPDINNTEDKALLMEMFHSLLEQEEEEENLKDKLIDLIKASDLTDKELSTFIKSVTNKGLKDDMLGYLNQRGYSADSFKVGDKAMEYIIDKISDSQAQEFTEYIKAPKKFANAPERGNFSQVTGLSQQLIQDLINIEPGADARGSSIGKGEVFLALAFSDIDNRSGGGDLNFNGKNLEVKGTGGRLGQQAGRGSDFDYLSYLGEKYLKDEELEAFLNNPNHKIINVSLHDLVEKAIKNGADKNTLIKDIQKALDSLYFNKGLAQKYFSSVDDFKDVAKMKTKLIKLNAESYAEKTSVGAFLFMDSKSGEYVVVDIDNLSDSIDAEKFGTSVKNSISGYQWDNPHPNMVIK